MPPNSIDINIHPTKTEIKFDDEHALYAILRSSAKHSLGQFNVSPVLDFERDSNLDTPYHYKNLDGSFNPFSEEKSPRQNTDNSRQRKPESSNWESLYVGLKSDTDSRFYGLAQQTIEEDLPMQFESEEVKASLFDDHETELTASKMYQLHRKYIVNPIKSGMVIIDQQRAHQRVLYEQFLTNMTVQHASSQQLLFPLHLYFSIAEMELIRELQLSLVNTGFVFEETNVDSVVISGLPVNVIESEVSIVLEQLISDLQDGIPESSFCQNDTIAKSMAKSLAVKTGSYLTEKEQENLVNGLFACKEPNVSPFQKPTFITMRVEDIDKKFAI